MTFKTFLGTVIARNIYLKKTTKCFILISSFPVEVSFANTRKVSILAILVWAMLSVSFMQRAMEAEMSNKQLELQN